MAQSEFSVQIRNSRTNFLNILKSRGFNTEKYDGASNAEVHAMFQHNQLDMLIDNPNTKKKVYVKYHLDKMLRPNNIYDFTSDIFEDDKLLLLEDDLIVISRTNANDTLQKTLRLIWNERKYFITVLGIESLQYNPLEHVLVPPHRVMSDEEASKIRKKYNIMNDLQIPDISRFSPIASLIGLRPGQMCEIIRPSKTAVTAPFYRICSV